MPPNSRLVSDEFRALLRRAHLAPHPERYALSMRGFS